MIPSEICFSATMVHYAAKVHPEAIAKMF